jgi:hypothetical protein
MAYQPQVPADTLSSAARGYKQSAKLPELDGLDRHGTKVPRPKPGSKACATTGNRRAPVWQPIPDGLVSALNVSDNSCAADKSG